MKAALKTLGMILALQIGGLATAAHAAVVRVVVESRTPMSGDFGAAGPYELIKGRYFGELDPRDPKNALITDLELAPRNARGMVEYSATFAISRPTDPAKMSGVLFYDVPNRGFGTAIGDPSGHVHVISGWQGDIPAASSRQRADEPVARRSNGAAVTGRVLLRLINTPAGVKDVALNGAGLSVSYQPASLDSAKASLVKRRSDRDAGEPVAPSAWAFGDCRETPFPGKADAHRLCLKDGFDPAFAYDLIYVAKDPPILGIGFAAVRDFNAFLRYSEGAAGMENPLKGRIRWALITGRSQSGNFVRSFINLGFNQAESGRIVFDGANPQIAARQVPLNIRFGAPGGAASLYEAGSDGVLWWGWHDDRARGRGRTSLLARCSKSATCPKIIETFGSTEFWGLRMSPDLVGLEAQADIPLPANVRRYYFPSVTHGGGPGGFDLAVHPTVSCTLPQNPNPSEDSVQALLHALVDWVTVGKLPPPSQYPSLSNGQLVAPTSAAMGFPTIPGAPKPDGMINPMLIYDFGPAFHYNDLSGVIEKVPPVVVREAPSLVPRVDRDGNETSGVPSVQARVPLGTYLGWNVTAKGYYAGEACGFDGGYIPFARTKAERTASGDPRLSLEERYSSHAGFVGKVRAAADDMVREGFLLPHDAERIVGEAEKSEVLR